MVKKIGKYWGNRLRFLEIVKRDNGKSPLSVLCKNIFSNGSALTKITDEMEENDFIIKEKYSRVVNTTITDKGERLLNILDELKEVLENED